VSDVLHSVGGTNTTVLKCWLARAWISSFVELSVACDWTFVAEVAMNRVPTYENESS